MSEDFEVAEVPQPEVTAEDSLEGVAQPEPVQGVRRGRKPDRQVRVQVSTYLDKETYQKTARKPLALAMGMNGQYSLVLL